VTVNPVDPIYLDHNATTPLLPEVVEAMLPFLRVELGNPSSDHPWGRRARDAVDRAREQVAELLGSLADEITFTSGGTEANNLAIRGTAEVSTKRRCVSSVIEHPATANPCRYLASHGWRVDFIAVDESARIRLDALESVLAEETALVTIMHANNETGTIQPIREAVRLAKARGALVHTDAAQSVGKVRVDVEELGVDLLSVAGHKLNAPKGVGALYVRRGTSIAPFMLGAGHERGLRPGTENVASIVGLGVACAMATKTLEAKTRRLSELRERLWRSLKSAIVDALVNGAAAARLPNTLSVRFPRARGSEVLAATPEVAASTGSACHAGHETASSVLLAMGLGPEEALSTVRLSVGVTTTEADVDAAAEALVRGWLRACGQA
jgi:cysteine desulfurase